jgi:hypothetical protein
MYEIFGWFTSSPALDIVVFFLKQFLKCVFNSPFPNNE